MTDDGEIGIMIVTLLIITCILNILVYLRASHHSALIPELSQVAAPHPQSWPRLSLIIPACNEEDTIEDALYKVLAIDYPDLQVIVVNDRSTDQTGAIIERVARSYTELQVVHIDTLPPGWLGKLNALHVGTERADGDYLIYADADVHFHAQFFKSVVAYAKHHELDYLSAIPFFRGESWILRSMIFAFSLLFISTTRLGSVNREDKGAYAGVGVFQMIRTSFFDQTPGWTWLKLEIGDDMAMAQMCHQHGARARFLRATDLLSLTWYPSAKALIKGLEKNSFPVGMRFSVTRTLSVSVMISLMVFSPWLLIASDHVALGMIFLSVFTLFNVCTYAPGISWWERALSPPLSLLIIASIWQSAWKTLRQKGVYWRGTFYSIEELKEGQRLKW